MSKNQLLEALEPLLHTISSLDLTHSNIANRLEEQHPFSALSPIKKLLLDGLKDGWLCPKGKEGLYYGRLKKADQGEISNLIGYSNNSPYEIPKNPDLIINTDASSDLKKNIGNFYKFILSKF